MNDDTTLKAVRRLTAAVQALSRAIALELEPTLNSMLAAASKLISSRKFRARRRYMRRMARIHGDDPYKFK